MRCTCPVRVPMVPRMARALSWCLAACAFTAPALAQAPQEPLRIVVGYSAGGSADQWARILAPRLSAEAGRPVIVENHPGAGGNVAADLVSRSGARSSLLYMTGASQHGAGAALNTGARWDPERDFTPIAAVAESVNVVVVRAASPYDSLQSLLAAGMRGDRPLTYASPGAGTSPHLAGELLGHRTGARLVHVPYRGASNALTDLMGGHVDLMVVTLTVVREPLLAGKLRALAVLSPQRSPALAAVPTAREAGVPGVEMRVWAGLVGPPGMPASKADELNHWVGKALDDPATAQRLQALGSQPFKLDRTAFRAFVHEELAAGRKLVKDAGMATQAPGASAP